MDFLSNNWMWLLPVLFIIAEKIVKVTPCKWDDIIVDIIVGTVKDTIAKRVRK